MTGLILALSIIGYVISLRYAFRHVLSQPEEADHRFSYWGFAGMIFFGLIAGSAFEAM
jgi:hypothetical protein